MTLPAIPETFRWTAESWGAALRCRPLEAFAPHAFTTRQLELSHPGAAGELARAIGAAGVVFAAQVHGAGVVVVRAGQGAPATVPEGDVVLSDSPDLAVAVRAADCVPVLLVDAARPAVAAVHAGWRGTATRAAEAAVGAMTRTFGTRPADVVAAIGPSIAACCYEVGSDVVDAFAAAGHNRLLIDRWFPLARPHGPPGGRPSLRLDLAAANRDQLRLAGVPEAAIHVVGLCTAMHLGVLTSFRAERERAGRIVAAIRAGAVRSGSPG